MIAIVEYQAGNVRSVANALDRLGYPSIITSKPEELQAAEKVIFPGVGEASSAMKMLMSSGLDEVIKDLKQPVLGVCLGLQLMCRHSEEGNTDGLGIFDTTVKRFPQGLKVPHMGWNNHQSLNGSLYNGISPEDNVYFVHSYYAEPNEQTVAVTQYHIPFASTMQHHNFYAVQFHPEKSGPVGARILQNFLAL